MSDYFIDARDEPNLATQQIHNFLADGQAKSGATKSTRNGGIQLDERIKEVRGRNVRWDPRALILHFEGEEGGLFHEDSNGDSAMAVGEFDRVA